MSKDFQDYFQSHTDYFWQWEEEGEVIAIPAGGTIAYREFVVALLKQLSDQGIPAFGALLLTIIATNPNAEHSLDTVYALLNKRLGTSNSTREPLDGAIVFLKTLAQVPPKYKQGKNRLLLLQTVFANCHNAVSNSRSRAILDFYKAHKIGKTSLLSPKPFHFGVYNNEFKVIALLDNRFPSVASILEKMAHLPLLQEIEIEGPELSQSGPKDFIQELIENTKTFPIGALIKQLWSGLHIPFHNALPSQQPVGGVSDLTNKGDFHRLLLSEFANDDLLFLSRLANNEALYINREMPPQKTELERIILIDVSIKAWGTPKTIAYALFLAIAKHPKTDISCKAFAVGTTFHPVAFDTVDNLIDSLQILEGCLHPAAGLETFLKAHAGQKNAEVFFITTVESLLQPALQKVLSEQHSRIDYTIQTNREGCISIYKRSHKSKKQVQQLQLPLETLWEKKPALRKPEMAPDEAMAYPVLFPGTLNPKKVFRLSDGEIYQITAERHLLRLYDKAQKPAVKGWQSVYESLPFSHGEAEMGLLENGETILLLFNPQNRELTFQNISTGVQESVHFNEWRSSVYKEFLFYQNLFYFSYLGYPSRHWTFEWNGKITIKSFENIPKWLTDLYKKREEEDKKALQSVTFTKGVLKNITSVFINEVDNLVFNIHELRLTDHNIIKLDKTGFVKRIYEAVSVGKNEFQFADGSTVSINRSGMIILKSTETVYVPAVLDAALGVATEADSAGNEYYLPKNNSGKKPLSTKGFWQQYLTPFIENIKQHGTSVKAIS